MKIVERDGWKFSNLNKDNLFLQVETKRLNECVDYCNKAAVRWLHISPAHGFKESNVDFLKECPNVEGIHLQEGITDINGLYHAKQLRFLCAVFENEIDFSEFGRLEELCTVYNPKLGVGLFNSKSLATLAIRKFKSKSNTLEEFASLSELGTLSIVMSSIKSGAGLELLPKLQNLTFAYCPKLRDIGPLRRLGDQLVRLTVDYCKALENFPDICTSMKVLEWLGYQSSRELDDLEFLKDMPALLDFDFYDTNVINGDLSPCLGLRAAHFRNKRHYSHSLKEVERQIAAKRIQTPIERMNQEPGGTQKFR